MTEELSIGNTIKIILALLVIAAVVGGIYLIFRQRILDFFGNLPGANITKTGQMFMSLLNK
jgi:hypothetical protein